MVMAGNLSPKLPWELANPKWAASLNPLLANPLVNGNLIQNIRVGSGNNVINHGLGRNIQGFMVIRNSANVTFYDAESSQPSLTFVLIASGSATISLYVF
jgi:hypothetical protein